MSVPASPESPLAKISVRLAERASLAPLPWASQMWIPLSLANLKVLIGQNNTQSAPTKLCGKMSFADVFCERTAWSRN